VKLRWFLVDYFLQSRTETLYRCCFRAAKEKAKAKDAAKKAQKVTDCIQFYIIHRPFRGLLICCEGCFLQLNVWIFAVGALMLLVEL